MNNKEFISLLASRNNIKASEAQRIMDNMIASLGNCFMEGDSVQLASFGCFEVKKKLERIMVNPTSGQRMLVPPKLVLNFKPTMQMKDKIKKGDE